MEEIIDGILDPDPVQDPEIETITREEEEMKAKKKVIKQVIWTMTLLKKKELSDMVIWVTFFLFYTFVFPSQELFEYLHL